ncbi:hypothetical protein E2C01_008474 [Portunus trituberculatus]|uniref:Uncharacterized protein n=1 Tax=Portunus trituberculatus TaxID=210409 RepID=A0A5B7D2Y4_PORTR|nr:hypothetical protein [Portunus trituberculatus]
MNALMVCSSPSYSASASAKELFTIEYHMDDEARHPRWWHLGTAGEDYTRRVVSRVKWSLSKELTRRISAVCVGILIKAT